MTTPPGIGRSMYHVMTHLKGVRDDGDDLFGFRTEVLAEFLDLDCLTALDLKPVDPGTWRAKPTSAAPADGAKYLEFAFGKALDHRGISAGRSVDKLTEYAWLQGRDDVVSAMTHADYAMYGVPKLLVYAQAFGLPVPDDEALRRMGRGEICDPEGCDAGCGT